MKSAVSRVAFGLILAAGLPASRLAAEEAPRPLPVLLIKGEIVSLDTNDPTAALLKVKDRYGFETPIYVTPEAKVIQGEATVPISSLATGMSVDVEYNFDVNTAKRHAVSVKAAAAAAPAPAQAAAAPAPEAPAAETAAPAAPASPAPAEPAQPSQPETAPAAPASP
jgi:hypothetical protein